MHHNGFFLVALTLRYLGFSSGYVWSSDPMLSKYYLRLSRRVYFNRFYSTELREIKLWRKKIRHNCRGLSLDFWKQAKIGLETSVIFDFDENIVRVIVILASSRIQEENSPISQHDVNLKCLTIKWALLYGTPTDYFCPFDIIAYTLFR